jgi:hypothetical protein
MSIPRGPVIGFSHSSVRPDRGTQVAAASPSNREPSFLCILVTTIDSRPIPSGRRRWETLAESDDSGKRVAGSFPTSSSGEPYPSIRLPAGLARTIMPPRTRITPSLWDCRRSLYDFFAEAKSS